MRLECKTASRGNRLRFASRRSYDCVLGIEEARNHRACFAFVAIIFHLGLDGDLRACFLD